MATQVVKTDDLEAAADAMDALIQENQRLRQELAMAEQVLRQAQEDLRKAGQVIGLRYLSRDSIEKFFARAGMPR